MNLTDLMKSFVTKYSIVSSLFLMTSVSRREMAKTARYGQQRIPKAKVQRGL